MHPPLCLGLAFLEEINIAVVDVRSLTYSAIIC